MAVFFGVLHFSLHLPRFLGDTNLLMFSNSKDSEIIWKLNSTLTNTYVSCANIMLLFLLTFQV